MTIILFLLRLAAVLTVAGGITIPLTYVGNNLEVFFSLQMAAEDVNKGGLLPSGLRLAATQQEAATLSASDRLDELMRRPEPGLVFTDKAFCDALTAVASTHRRLVLSHACGDEKLSDKKRYPTVMRTRPSDRQAADAMAALVRRGRWRRVCLVVQQSAKWRSLARLVARRIRTSPTSTSTSRVSFADVRPCCRRRRSCCHEPWAYDVVRRTRRRTQVYVFLGDAPLLAKLVQTLADWNRSDRRRQAVVAFDGHAFTAARAAQYVRSGIGGDSAAHFGSAVGQRPLEPPASLSVEPDGRWAGPQRSADASAPLLLVVARATPEAPYGAFTSRLRRFGRRADRLGSAFDEHASLEATYIYDAVTIFASAVSRLATADLVRDAANGSLLFDTILAQPNYTSVTGRTIRFDRQGERFDHYVVFAVGPNSTAARTIGSFSDAEHVMWFPFQEFEQLGAFDWALDDAIDDDSDNVRPEEDDERMAVTDRILCASLMWSSSLAVVLASATHLVRRSVRRWPGVGVLDAAFDVEKLLPHTVCVNAKPATHRTTVGDFADWRSKVWTKTLTSAHGRPLDVADVVELNVLTRLRHRNVNRVLDVFVERRRIHWVSPFCGRGSLWDLLERSDDRLLDHEDQLGSLVLDLARGLAHLHACGTGHGNLKSTNCLVDDHWTLRLADFGLAAWRPRPGRAFEDLWRAPEVLRGRRPAAAARPSPQADLYAFGIVVHELLGRRGPFGLRHPETALRRPQDVVDEVVRGPSAGKPPYRPPLNCVVERWNGRLARLLCPLMKQCWRENPDRRPASVGRVLRRLEAASLPGRLEGLVELGVGVGDVDVGSLVGAAKEAVMERVRHVESVLCWIRPQPGAASTPPRVVEQASILVADIVGFTQMSSVSTPTEVMYLLDDVFTMLDAACRRHSCTFKLGTVGDAYVAVGVDSAVYRSLFHGAEAPPSPPERAVTCDSTERIAWLALDILERMVTLPVPRSTGRPLVVRIGLHQGPAALGVVGWFWIFGSTLSLTFELQSSGSQVAVQISEACYRRLVASGRFQPYLVERPSRCLLDDTVDLQQHPSADESFRSGFESRTYWLRHPTGRLLVPSPPLSRRRSSAKLCYRGSSASLLMAQQQPAADE